MKTATTILLILLTVIACGCSAAAPAQQSGAASSGSAAVAGILDLTGTWTGPMQGYDQGTGFSEYQNFTVTMNITEQKGRIFAGKILFTLDGNESVSGFAGAVGRDGRTLSITEEDGGYCTGEIVGENEIELIYMEDGSPYSVAIDSFRRD